MSIHKYFTSHLPSEEGHISLFSGKDGYKGARMLSRWKMRTLILLCHTHTSAVTNFLCIHTSYFLISFGLCRVYGYCSLHCWREQFINHRCLYFPHSNIPVFGKSLNTFARWVNRALLMIRATPLRWAFPFCFCWSWVSYVWWIFLRTWTRRGVSVWYQLVV
jgi:hypothetical protein